MKVRRSVNIAVATAMTMMVVAACSSSESPEPSATGGAQATGQPGGDLRVYNAEPAFLNPSAASDEPSIYVLRQLYRGLVTYNAETGKAEMDIAESIESSDQKNWTVKLKPGFTFENGEPVNADAFIRVELRRVRPERPGQRVLHEPLRGYRGHVVGGPGRRRAEGTAPEPKAKELSGLKKVSDNEFTIELAEPFAALPSTLGYSGFFPMAEACSRTRRLQGLQREADRQRRLQDRGLLGAQRRHQSGP